MECTWDADLLRRGDELPPELLEVIQNGSNEQYLQALTKASLDAKYTYILLAHAGTLFAHICASLREHASFAETVASLGRIVPNAPYLTPYATQLLEREQYAFEKTIDDGRDLLYLLGLLRLLRHDHRIFGKFVPTCQLLSRLEGTSDRAVKYLIIRILQIKLNAADHAFETILKQYLGQDSPENTIEGHWDETIIDYRFLSLWEEDRSEYYQRLLSELQNCSQSALETQKVRHIPLELVHPSAVSIGGILLPRLGPASFRDTQNGDNLVVTETVAQNLRTIAHSLKSSDPLLVSGLPGSGKTLLLRYAAQALDKLETMVTLHLNEQSDAKLLLGVYTTGETAGSFVWKPGVLTTAVQEGRWVLIEDLDRAPNEVLGTLLPLIEKRELLIPNRKDTIHAAEGFRILATVRSNLNHRGEEPKPLTHMLGFRHWISVSVAMQTSQEHADIISNQYPTLVKHIPQFMAAYERLVNIKSQPSVMGQSKTGAARPISPRDLLKWCQRVAVLHKGRKTFTSSDVDDIFLEAIDCFMGAIPEGEARDSLAAAIAEELHINPERRDYLLHVREVQYQADKSRIIIGRHSVQRARQEKVKEGTFSTNPHTTRMLERVTAAITNREPLLLVGETGVGKTTAAQHLATHLRKKLVPFNMSQQSEVGDLLGGFKPINTRTLIIPLKDEFDDLFAESFSENKNKAFLKSLNQCMARSNWKKVCQCFRTALGIVDEQKSNTPPPREGEAPAKKRKTESKRAIDFAKWDAFKLKVDVISQKLSSGTDAFAFTFVEGTIIKAVRNGDWVLLDEINLASPDTLESIADLLDPAPSILLTEAGAIERIEAHPDFRLFAAMNPATDVGKKDLPPGIRSRFTEIYVDSPDKDRKSLESIVGAYLRQEAASDPAVTTAVSYLFQGILRLAEENKLVDGAGQKPHFSLRTLTRTLSYAKHIQRMCNLRRALYEGFQMSFLTFLDFESAQLVEPLIQHCLFMKVTDFGDVIQKARDGTLKVLEGKTKQALQKPLRQPEEEHGRAHIQGHPGSKHWIRQGDQEVQDQPHYIITPFIQRNLENLVRAASTRQFPVLIQGPTSAGKTSMIEYLAERTGHKFTRINNHEHTDLQEYLGSYIDGADGRFRFQEGVLVNALREGHWIVLDELNLAPTDVLEALNRLLDDNRELLVPETQEIIRPHPDFMLFATQNPAGLYGGRKTLSRAFRNRFLELHFDDIPVDELQTILHQRTQLPPKWCARIVTVYKDLSILRQENRLFEQKSFATLRDLFRWAFRPNDTIEQLAANGYMLLCERVRKPEERVALQKIIETAMSAKGPKVRIDEDALYAPDCAELQQYQQNATEHSIVWTKAMRRLYVLVSKAIANNEPVLLVGETGCGKTTVCQVLSDALRKTLHTVNAHQNTETADLIGSQRPVRNRASIEASLRGLLLRQPPLQTVTDREIHDTDSLLADYDQALSQLTKEQKESFLRNNLEHNEIQRLRLRSKQLFEWVDGSLVQAMREGDLFLLDEISLADDSVLERINSVLESSRTILLAEKGSLDSFVAASPGFQFFATMNPGGDYGKRELSPALRNRFTEIWVPAMSDMEDVLLIVQSKLVEPAQPYAKAMIDFASWFKSRFDTSASSSVSIRDTLAWVQFVNAFAHAGVVPAVAHGAAMVYIDTLGANPAGLITLSSSNIQTERAACLDHLSHLLQDDAHRLNQATFTVQSTATQFGIGPFTIPRLPSYINAEDTFTFDPPTTKTNAMRVLRALQLSKPVMLEGSPGVGKTALVTAIASAAARPLTRINLSDQTDLLDLFGSDAPLEGAQTGTFVWRDAPFLRAMKRGEWVLLDEMNLASQSVLEGLNACLDHRGEVFVPELGQAFTKHPDFRLFAAQNPHHQGCGRKGLPASFVNRFTVVYADSFEADDLKTICERTFPLLDKRYVEQAVEFVSRLNNEVANKHSFGASGGPWEFNLRDITRWLGLASSGQGLLKAGTPRDFVRMLFRQRFRSTHDQNCVDELFLEVFQDAQPASDAFYNSSTTTLQMGLAVLARDDAVAKPLSVHHQIRAHSGFLRAMESTMLCVGNVWPVILTGSPGTGKTSLVESLAATVGADVVTLGMSVETDALDLIGGYEQHDPHRQYAEALSEVRLVTEKLCKTALAAGSPQQAATLRDAFEQIAKELIATSLSHERLVNFIQGLPATLSEQEKRRLLQLLEPLQNSEQSINKARFEWIDGPLIEGLRKGKWLVLDNANLCSPSVLDRLNGLMEPNGVLIVNEHTEQDGSARIIKPHPGFRIFLTVDPRLGELSRAMRNRAVEIFMTPASGDASVTGLGAEAATLRFRTVKAIPSRVEGDVQSQNLARDHLGLCDQRLFARFQRQLRVGLYKGPLGRETSVLAETSLLPNDPTPLQSLYDDSSSSLQASADFACVQTFHPLNNQPLVQQSQPIFIKALLHGAQHDVGVSLDAMISALASAKADRKLVDRLAKFWKANNVRSKASKTALLEVIQKMLSTIQSWLRQMPDSDVQDIHTAKRAQQGLLAFCATFLDVLTSSSLDLPQLTASTLVGQALCHKTLGSAPALAGALQPFVTPLNELGLALDAQARHAFVAMWKALKPAMPSNMETLQALMNFEWQVAKYDQAVSEFQRPVKEVVEYRNLFQLALDSSTTDWHALTEKVAQAFPEAVATSEFIDNAVQLFPHYRNSFEHLCQHFALFVAGDHTFQLTESTQLEVLAQRKTIDGMHCTRSLEQGSAQFTLRGLGLSVMGSSETSALQPVSIARSLRSDMKSVESVNLANLNLLETEARFLGRLVASRSHTIQEDVLEPLDKCLHGLLMAVLHALAAADEPGPIETHCQRLLGLLQAASSHERIELDHKDTSTNRQESVCQRLSLVAKYICQNNKLPALMSKRQYAARTWTDFAIACLDLHVPEHAFDPVQESRIRVMTYQNHRGGLQAQLTALQAFRLAWTGKSESLRARLLQEDLHALGESPPVIEICRPEKSLLGELQGDMRGLMRVIDPLRDNFAGGEMRVLDQGALSNLRVLRTRLCDQKYRAYADLASPVVGFVDCVLIAHGLVEPDTSGNDLVISPARLTPLFGARLQDWLLDESFIQAQQSARSKEEHVVWLSTIAARSAIVKVENTAPALFDAADASLRLFYEAWKTELSRDQKAASAKSSLYQYRGGDDDSEEATAEQLAELFPSYEGSSLTKPSPEIDAQALAPTMARLYHQIYSDVQLEDNQLLDLLQQASELPSANGDSNMTAIMASFHKLSTDLSNAPRSKNIYTDSDLAQSKALVGLISKIQARFTTIHNAWPEHAVPIDVLKACNQTLALGHAEPVARYLQPVEKIYSAMSEWQKVASSEYSAANLLEETTNLIVGWRQLELSTWAGLFEQEDAVCRKNASSWWYIAYETIILAADGRAESSGAFAQQLLETLGSFLSSCGLGEFHIRLAMLRDFEADLAIRAKVNGASAAVREALASLISYYAHFASSIAEHLAKKRAELEKQVREVVKLASWKDRNVERLRDNAKKSHKKLFRMVRKYRVLLAEPVAPLLTAEFPKVGNDSGHEEVTRNYELDAATTSTPNTIKAWRGRPKEIQDLDAVKEQITSSGKSVQALAGASERIDKFIANLEEEAAELRKATPSTATEENKTLVQHLKTRKRRLLADILRDVRLMGFQTNLAEDVLAQQQSLHGVLAESAPLALHAMVKDVGLADHGFHRFLHVMPTVRDSAVKHNEDLTPAEIARSKIFLESMLHTSIEQRNSIARELMRHASLSSSLAHITAIASAEGLTATADDTTPLQMLQIKAASLSAVVIATTKCVQMHSELAGRSYDQVTTTLRSTAGELETFTKPDTNQRPLPQGLTSEDNRSLEARLVDVTSALDAGLKEYEKEYPELQSLLAQLHNWTNITSTRARKQSQATASVEQWTIGITQILSTVHQNVHKSSELQLAGSGNKKAWLVKQQSRLKQYAQDLGVGDVSTTLKDLVQQTPQLNGKPDQKVILAQVSSICRDVQPVLVAYLKHFEHILNEQVALQASMTKMAHRLALSFIDLAQHGFCTPSEKAQGEDQSGQVESGTGLGDGEGGEDISKDVGADEDLSELAQDATAKDKEGENEADKDAVDMADEDLEGKFDEDAGSEGDEEDGDEKEDGEDADLDEETGHVGEDDDAVDEKTWDDGEKGQDADKEAEKGKGTKNDDHAAAENAEAGDEQEPEEQDMGDEGEAGEDVDDVEAEAGANDPEQADPHMQEEENLDLPEDLNMDGDAKSISDIDAEDDLPEDLGDVDAQHTEEAAPEGQEDVDVEMGEGKGNEDDERPVEAQENEDAAAEEQGDDASSDVAMLDNDDQQQQQQPDDGLTSADAGQGQEQNEAAAQKSGAVSTEAQQDDQEANQANEQAGATEGTQRTQADDASGQAETGEQQQSQPFKQLGDVLKQWYNQHRNIENAQEQQDPEQASKEDVDMSDPRFEHIPENTDSDIQALGAANVEQSRALDEQNAIDVNESAPDDVPLPEEASEQPPEDEAQQENENAGAKAEGGEAGSKPNNTKVGKATDPDRQMEDALDDEDEEDNMEEVDEQLTNTHLDQQDQQLLSIEEARKAWSDHETRTRNMAIVLTEHLRLILQPTQVTKMRGDFRTGKRLNIKKIIPYIASDYKRDKIWMRRSIPSKRSYQIMLAIDDSESMNEFERKGLAFDTLALVAKSMSMLEVGELSILGFGATTNVAHDFSTPFTSDAGAEVYRQFTFSQTQTNVKRLLEKSIELFRATRVKATGSASNLWQLQLIISDGHFEQHSEVRQLIRQAHEEQIMVVFIVVDATQGTSAVAMEEPRQSINDLSKWEFVDGEPVMRKYMDTFPFRYYITVGDVLELPGVLATALRQWFAEVVDSDG